MDSARMARQGTRFDQDCTTPDGLTTNPPSGWVWEAIRLGTLPQHVDRNELRQLSGGSELKLYRITWRAGTTLRVRCPDGTVALIVQVGDDGTSRLNGRPLRPSECGLLSAGRDHQLIPQPDTDFLFATLNADQLHDRARRLWKRQIEPGLWDRLIATVPNQRALLTREIEAWFRGSDARPHNSSLLDTLLLTSQPEPTSNTLPKRHQIAIAVESELRASLRSNISISDLCRSYGIGERLLRKGFVEWFGAAPTSYLKALRLQKIRAQLLAHSRRTTSITTIASHWGVTHMGRFSADYQMLFGEYPNTTLQRQGGDSRG